MLFEIPAFGTLYELDKSKPCGSSESPAPSLISLGVIGAYFYLVYEVPWENPPVTFISNGFYSRNEVVSSYPFLAYPLVFAFDLLAA